jgi:hypothetical protein
MGRATGTDPMCFAILKELTEEGGTSLACLTLGAGMQEVAYLMRSKGRTFCAHKQPLS